MKLLTWLWTHSKFFFKKYTTKNAQFDIIIKENAILKDINKVLKEKETTPKDAVKKNQNGYKIVKERSSGPTVYDTKRPIIKESENSTLKKTVLKEQFFNIKIGSKNISNE